MALDSLVVPLIYLCAPWVFLEIAFRCFTPRHAPLKLRTRQQGILSTGIKITFGNTWISRGSLWIKIETTTFNKWPAHFLRSIFKRTRARRRSNGELAMYTNGNGHDTALFKERRVRWLDLTYSAGSVFAGMALFGSIAFLLWGAFDLIGKIIKLSSSSVQATPAINHLRKRDETILENTVKVENPLRGLNLVPLIPGLTIPFNHIYPLVIALFLTQMIHEAGHAICGALYHWTPLRAGLILIFPCIPGAFVTLPHEALEDEEEEDGRSSSDTSHRRKFNIVSAGVWHNALSALFVAFILYGGIGSISHGAFWKTAESLTVESIVASSPLVQHMPPGTTITRIDDLDLNQAGISQQEQAWHTYLTNDINVDEMGWCVSAEAWQSESSECCDILKDPTKKAESNVSGLCYIDLQSPSDQLGHCYDPISLVSGKTEKRRCTGICPNKKDICIAPHPKEQLIRITIKQSNTDASRVVLFQGNPKAVYAAITLSDYAPRLGSLSPPYSVFRWWNLFLSYFLNLSMAMALLNMLPLPSLDGDVYLGLVIRAIIPHFQLKVNNEVIDEEVAVEMELGRRDIFAESRDRSNIHSLQRRSSLQSNTSPLAKFQKRLRWLIICLAVFVFGGSIVVHSVDY